MLFVVIRPGSFGDLEAYEGNVEAETVEDATLKALAFMEWIEYDKDDNEYPMTPIVSFQDTEWGRWGWIEDPEQNSMYATRRLLIQEASVVE
jgi:hypothetical protein